MTPNNSLTVGRVVVIFLVIIAIGSAIILIDPSKPVEERVIATTNLDDGKIFVDYSKSVDQLVAELGSTDKQDPDICDRYFAEEKKEGSAKLEMVVLQFDHSMTRAEIELSMAKSDYRPATLKELLVFARNGPNVSEHFFVWALGSIGKKEGRFPIVVGMNMKDGRLLYEFDYGDGTYGSGDEYLAVRE